MTSLLLAALLSSPAAAQSRVAGGVVSSREWHVKRGEAKEEEFTGDVRYRTGASVVRCDWALYKHEPQTWQLRGHVSLDRKLDSGDRALVSGDQGFYDGIKKSGWVSAGDRVAFSREPADGSEPDRGTAKRLDFEGGRTARLSGDVRTWGPRADTWSDHADYDHGTGAMTLTGGRPVLDKKPGWDAGDEWAGAVKADEVRTWRARRRVEAEGRVQGWLEFKNARRSRR